MSLQNKAMLIVLSVSCWTAVKQDKQVASEVEKQHNATNGAGRYNKLLIDKVHLDPLTSHASAIRAYHYKMTLPWMDNGARLLPSKMFMEYTNGLNKLQREYEALVDTFVNLYDTKLVQEARNRLGTMFDAMDYPLSSELRGKFGVTTDIQPVPDGADFRVDISDAERQRISKEITERVAKRQASAINEAWSRVRQAVTQVVTRLTADKAIFRDSLIDNMEELTRLLPGLNVNDDPLMDNVCQRIIKGLIVPPERLRRSISERRRVVAEAQSILAMIPS